MPQPALTVFLIIAAIAIVVVLIAVIVIALRAQRRRKLAQTLEKRRDDEVQYAFIVNPSKPQAEARRLHIQRFCEAKGLNRIRFYDTQLDKDGRVCALEALEDGADVVIAVGGDGTVRTVASAVSGTGHALGIIPIGTGNLFARNMGVPVDDIDAALTVATSHGSRLVDMGRLTLLDHPEDDHGHAFLIIAGIGFDAAMIDDTNPELKANISWLAYFVGGVKNLFAPKFRGTLTVTSADGSTHTIKNLDFRTVMAGNCGQIPMFSLMPAASYDDGLLDFEIIDTTGGILGWANLFGDVVHQTIIGKPEQNPLSTNSTIEQVQGVSAEITLEKPAKAQVDGDMLPETRHIRFLGGSPRADRARARRLRAGKDRAGRCFKCHLEFRRNDRYTRADSLIRQSANPLLRCVAGDSGDVHCQIGGFVVADIRVEAQFEQGGDGSRAS